MTSWKTQGLWEGADKAWTNNALQLQHGWMDIHDNCDDLHIGRIGDPGVIIGSMLVQDSKILPGTFQAVPLPVLQTGLFS